MLTIRWDDGSTTSVDRRRTVGSDTTCDTTLGGLAELHLLIESVGRWALVEDVSGGSLATVLIDGVALTGRQALQSGATISVGPRTGQMTVVGEESATDGLLTDRQLDVMACLGDGDTVEAAAERLELSPNTVRSHVQSAYRRLDVSSKPEALGVLFARGIFQDRRSGNCHPDGLYAGLVAERSGDDVLILPPNFSAWEQATG